MAQKNIFETVRRNIICFRKMNGLSQTDLAKKMKTSQRLVAYYENKASSMPLDKVQDFAEALETSVGALLDERPINGIHDIDLRLLKKLKQIEQLPRRARDAVMHSINTAIENHILKEKHKKGQ
jgi:transcriptional regulator with XRE-family HTH domain